MTSLTSRSRTLKCKSESRSASTMPPFHAASIVPYSGPKKKIYLSHASDSCKDSKVNKYLYLEQGDVVDSLIQVKGTFRAKH